MINHKKKILIKKHLGENTPEWIINNCIAMLNEYEEVELDGYTKAKNNEVLDLVSHQRELLKAFQEHYEKTLRDDFIYDDDIESFLNDFNCG